MLWGFDMEDWGGEGGEAGGRGHWGCEFGGGGGGGVWWKLGEL